MQSILISLQPLYSARSTQINYAPSYTSLCTGSTRGWIHFYSEFWWTEQKKGPSPRNFHCRTKQQPSRILPVCIHWKEDAPLYHFSLCPWYWSKPDHRQADTISICVTQKSLMSKDLQGVSRILNKPNVESASHDCRHTSSESKPIRLTEASSSAAVSTSPGSQCILFTR